MCTVPEAGAFDATSGNPDPGIPSLEGGADATFVSVPGPSCEAGACGLECGGGNLLCSGLCYDSKSFHDHCGDCMTACPASQWCHGGHCCDAGMESCDGGCIDVVGNASNCGACGNSCPDAAATCFQGACVNMVTTVCGKSNPTGILCSGNCSTNHAQYADAYCKLAGFTSAVSYTVLTSGSVQCLYYTGGVNSVPTSCSVVTGPASYGLATTCDAIQYLICQ